MKIGLKFGKCNWKCNNWKLLKGTWCMNGIYVKTRKGIHGINLLLLLLYYLISDKLKIIINS